MKRLTTILAILAALVPVGCNTTNEAMSERAREAAEKSRTGPKAPVVKNITNFSSALRCMDEKMMMYGIRDLVVITEDIDDKTQKVAAGAKDMLISAVSTMTQRSHAIRLIVYGKDSGNLIGFMNQREEKGPYQLNPTYGIRGSISQYDESVARESEGGGFFWSKYGSAGASTSAAVSMLGLDLTMVRTEDLTIVPGVTSNNTVAIVRSGTGASVEAAIHKFGVDFEMNLSRSEGAAQALRNLIDLAVIELFGKLTKTPYWTCLSGSANTPAVKNEIDSWYYNLFADQKSFVAYWQNQMRLRGLYNKEANGIAENELGQAIEIYREALGLAKNTKLDQQFFTAYLNANHYRVMEKVQNMFSAKKAAQIKVVQQPKKNTQPVQQTKSQAMEETRKLIMKNPLELLQPRTPQSATQVTPTAKPEGKKE